MNPQLLRLNTVGEQLILVGPTRDVIAHNSTMSILSYSLKTNV